MSKWRFQLLSLCLLCSALAAAGPESAPVAQSKPVRVFVIPIRDQVGSAVLYVVRRGLKEAIAEHADAVVFDMKTPGGALDTTFEIMEAIGNFPGPTITYVNTEAMSAGAFIAARTEEIWFAPSGIIGAAAPVSSGGQDVEATMKLKIVSYLKARVRAMSDGKGYRGQVISAMIDAERELKIEDNVIKEKGELLSLTDVEAAKTYGDPPRTLLSAGTAKSIDELIAKKFPGAVATKTTLDLTWSEDLAVWLNMISPILLGIGMLALFIEFKTPGFGMFGIVGIACLAIVFLGNYVAGLSGHEPMLVFGAGLLLVATEIFFFPGVAVMIIAGLTLMFGSLIWSMADLWPNEPLTVAWSGDVFLAPLANLGLGIVIAVALGLALARFIPRGWMWNRMVLNAAVDATAQGESGPAAAEPSLLGARGLAVTDLRPGGQVEIAGRRYEAKVEVGAIDAGATVVVRGHSDFGLVVERAAS